MHLCYPFTGSLPLKSTGHLGCKPMLLKVMLYDLFELFSIHNLYNLDLLVTITYYHTKYSNLILRAYIEVKN